MKPDHKIKNCQEILLAVFFMSCITTHGANAGAWNQPAGKWQAITTASYYTTAHYADNHGEHQDQGRYRKFELNPYAEYGLNDKWTLGISTALQALSGDDTLNGKNEHNWGLGDTELFSRYNIINRNGWVLSAQPLIKLPSIYNEDHFPKSGSKYFDAEARLLGGYSFDALGVKNFIDTEIAYRKRFSTPADQIRWDTTIGAQILPNLQLLGQAFTTFRTEVPNMVFFTQSEQDDYDLVKFQFSGVYDLGNGMAVQLGGFHHTWARNSGLGGGGLLAFWTEF